MNIPSAKTTQRRRARAGLLWVGLIVPLGVIALAAAVMFAWLPEMPDPAAIHWSGAGPDGFGPPWANLLLPLGVGVGMVLVMVALGLLAQRLPSHRDGTATLLPRSNHDPSATVRLLGAVSLGLSVLLAVLGLAIMGVQRGLDDARDAPDIGPWAALAFALLVGFALLGWFVQPSSSKQEPLDATQHQEPWRGGSAAPLPLPAGARAAWFGTSTLSRTGIVTISLFVFVTLGVGVVLLAFGRAGGWFAVGVGLLLVVMLLSTSVFYVRADAEGLHLRSAVGWPRYAIAAEEIAAVRAIQVNPFSEFGGWGIRWGADGRFGIVLRTGEGIEVARINGKTVIVTLDDAVTAAAVLSAAASTGKEQE